MISRGSTSPRTPLPRNGPLGARGFAPDRTIPDTVSS